MNARPQPPRRAAARPAARRSGREPHRWAAVAFDVLTLAAMLTAVIVRQGHAAFPGTGALVFAVAAWLPLLVRTRWPLAVLAATVAIECAHLAIMPFSGAHPAAPVAMGAYQPVPLATMVAVWTVASRRRWPVGWVAGGTAAAALLAVSLAAQPLFLVATDIVMFNVVIIAAGAGVLVSVYRDHVARLARERLADTHRQVVAERLRIARDLHDVLAHHLALVNAQASVAEYLLRTDSAAAAAALSDISVNTRQALDELRATVGLLRQDTDSAEPAGPQEAARSTPGIDHLGELTAGFRSAGMTISLSVTGTPRALAPGGDLAAYRIAEEALTNVAKHAPGARTDVTACWLEDRLEVCVVNGPAPGPVPGHGHEAGADGAAGPADVGHRGHGITGMRERVRSCGGTLTAQPTPEGGFAVRASIPAGIPAGGRGAGEGADEGIWEAVS